MHREDRAQPWTEGFMRLPEILLHAAGQHGNMEQLEEHPARGREEGGFVLFSSLGYHLGCRNSPACADTALKPKLMLAGCLVEAAHPAAVPASR